MLEGTKSPGYYGSEIYSHLVKKEPGFGQKVSQDQFLKDIQDDRYSSQIYEYLTKLDRSFANSVSLEDFISSVKKKRRGRYGFCWGRYFIGIIRE